MLWAALIGGLIIGILGNLHCVGMCGPLALSIPFPQNSSAGRWLGILIYNLGRVFTYTLIGVILGWIGSQFAVFGWQQNLSVIIGVLMLIAGITAIFRTRLIRIPGLQIIWNNAFGKVFSKLFQKANYPSLFLIGVLNGLLPCGLVYIALAGALATGNLIHSAVFMFGFGIATLPAMVAVSYAGSLMKMQWQRFLKKLSPYVIIIMSVLLILRGLNLNIPYISPALNNDKVECCSSNEDPNHKY